MLVERNAAFDRCIDFLVRMMEKYSNGIVFLEEIPGNHQMSDGKKEIEEGRGDADTPAPIHRYIESVNAAIFGKIIYIVSKIGIK